MTKHSWDSGEFIDYYQLLGVPKSADVATIKRAYRSQIARHHPDRADGRHDDEMASLLNTAYATLKDAELRQRYDERWLEYQSRQWLLAKKQQVADTVGSFAKQQVDKLGKVVKSKMPTSVQDNIASGAGRIAGQAIKHAKRLWRQLNHTSELPICQIGLQLAYHGGEVTFTVNHQTWQTTLPKGLTTGDTIHLTRGADTVTVQIAIHDPNVIVRGLDVYYTVALSRSDIDSGAQVLLPPPLSLQLGVPAHAHYPTSVRLSGRGLPSGDSAGDLVVVFEVQG